MVTQTTASSEAALRSRSAWEYSAPSSYKADRKPRQFLEES
jgi:hypothetical protein